MKIRQAAYDTLLAAKQGGNPGQRSELGVGLSHAAWMLWQIKIGEVAGEKAHRWLGWAQCMLVSNNTSDKFRLTLEQCQKINKANSSH